MSNEVLSGKIEISDVIKEECTSQVNETLAVKSHSAQKASRNFTVYEMWNRQRNSRSATTMIRRWNLN